MDRSGNEYMRGTAQTERLEKLERKGWDVLDMCKGGMVGVMKLELTGVEEEDPEKVYRCRGFVWQKMLGIGKEGDNLLLWLLNGFKK